MLWNEDTEETTGIIREEKYGRTNITYVEIVQCKHCKHWERTNGHCPFNSIFTNPDWFCADGEKNYD